MRDDVFRCDPDQEKQNSNCHFDSFVRTVMETLEASDSKHEKGKVTRLNETDRFKNHIGKYFPFVLLRACADTTAQICSDSRLLLVVTSQGKKDLDTFAASVTGYVVQKMTTNIAIGLDRQSKASYVKVLSRGLKFIPLVGSGLAGATSGAASLLLDELRAYWRRRRPVVELALHQALSAPVREIVAELGTLKGARCAAPLAARLRSVLMPFGNSVFKTPTKLADALKKKDIDETRMQVTLPGRSGTANRFRLHEYNEGALFGGEMVLASDENIKELKAPLNPSLAVVIQTPLKRSGKQVYFRNGTSELVRTLFSTVGDIFKPVKKSGRGFSSNNQTKLSFEVNPMPDRTQQFFLTMKFKGSHFKRVVTVSAIQGPAATNKSLDNANVMLGGQEKTFTFKKTPLGLGMEYQDNAVVVTVKSDSQAARMNVQPGFRVVSVNGTPTATKKKVVRAIGQVKTGAQFLVTFSAPLASASPEQEEAAVTVTVGEGRVVEDFKTKGGSRNLKQPLNDDDVLVFRYLLPNEAPNDARVLRIKNTFETLDDEETDGDSDDDDDGGPDP